MFQKINTQFIFSYLGLIPYFFIILDKYYFFQIKEEILLDFSVYYTLIIIVFIGSMNWNLHNKIENYIVFYGVSPSLFATLIIFLNLINFSLFLIIFFLILILIFQLYFDYILIYSRKINKKVFFLLRIPLTIAIIFILIIIKF